MANGARDNEEHGPVKRKQQRRRAAAVAQRILEPAETSVVDVLDHVLAKGVMATGDVTLGVAGIDLIYLRLSALLCAADRVLPVTATKRRRGGPSRLLPTPTR
jgi:hypothetical protein